MKIDKNKKRKRVEKIFLLILFILLVLFFVLIYLDRKYSEYKKKELQPEQKDIGTYTSSQEKDFPSPWEMNK